MRKNNTSDRIMYNDADYSFENFLKELWKDVEASISQEDFAHISNSKERNIKYKKSVREVSNFVYEICSLAAIRDPRLKRILDKANDKEKEIVEKTIKSYKDSIGLLRAIFVREISAEIEKGLTKRQAAKVVVDRSKSTWILFLRSQATPNK